MSNEVARDVLGYEATKQFDRVGITVAAPEAIREWSRVKSKIPKQSTIAHSNRSQAVFFASASSVQFAITNAHVVNISASSIRGDL